jgi:hypothetical protein
MVRAILAGRKTQTRRIVKPQPELTDNAGFVWNGCAYGAGISSPQQTERNFVHKCPHGKYGERLWVRETWWSNGERETKDTVCYRADEEMPKHMSGTKWKSAMFMPRWASRITLEVALVRIQRLQDITTNDCLAEGILKLPATGRYVTTNGGQYFGAAFFNAREAFQGLWEGINGQGSWAENPWVWAITFKRVE